MKTVSLVVLCAFLASCSQHESGSTDTVKRDKAVLAEAGGDVMIKAITGTYRAEPVANPGSVSGTVSVKNVPPAVAPISTGSFSTICGATAQDESIQLSGNQLGGAVVWLDGIRAGKPFPDERRLELETDQCKLHPRVQGALTGSAVNIIGHDDFRQHLRFIASGDAAPRAAVLLGGGEQVIPTELPFTKPGLVLVRDPGHAWTRAYLAVFDHPYFAVTAPNGTFKIDGVPPGKYTLHVWHERAGETDQTVDVGAAGDAKVAIQLNAK